MFVAGPNQTFDHLVTAINTSFGRWDHAHLHAFQFTDGTIVGPLDAWDAPPEGALHSETTKLRRLALGEQFLFQFDFGDNWIHVCTVGDTKVDPEVELGGTPFLPWAVYGAGEIPDQYGARWLGDEDLDAPPPPDPEGEDLRALLDQMPRTDG
ncbi:MAG TPA: hypothetical protein VNS19_01415 [Acidimicrobiales bacterium]|nr:hypothetical protein [Acidimicrobiales bacterium]